MLILDVEQWLAYGRSQGWCGPAVCATHDGTPTSETEDLEFEEGFDPCIHILRLYENSIKASEVAKNHSPSVWRG